MDKKAIQLLSKNILFTFLLFLSFKSVFSQTLYYRTSSNEIYIDQALNDGQVPVRLSQPVTGNHRDILIDQNDPDHIYLLKQVGSIPVYGEVYKISLSNGAIIDTTFLQETSPFFINDSLLFNLEGNNFYYNQRGEQDAAIAVPLSNNEQSLAAYDGNFFYATSFIEFEQIDKYVYSTIFGGEATSVGSYGFDSENSLVKMIADEDNDVLYWVEESSSGQLILKKSDGTTGLVADGSYDIDISLVMQQETSGASSGTSRSDLTDIAINSKDDRFYLLVNASSNSYVITLRLSDGSVIESERINSLTIFKLDVLAAQPVDPLLVTNTNSSGLGSLDSAVAFANFNIGPDTIRFDPSLNDQTILLDTLLEITGDSTVIWVDNFDTDSFPDVAIRATNPLVNSVISTSTTARYTHIHGLVIQGNYPEGGTAGGIRMRGEYSKISSCFVGINFEGTDTTSFSRVNKGIAINGNYSSVGDKNLFRNVISGNHGEAVDFETSTGGIMLNNYIGTDVTGTQALGNGNVNGGAVSLFSADSTKIGDGTIEGLNLISGNKGGAISSSDNDNIIDFNYIGTDINGVLALRNELRNILLHTNANRNIIRNNIIASTGGIGISNNNASDLLIENNRIGISITGTNIGNTGSGISSSGLRTLIRNNIIAFNGQNGIRVGGTSSDSINISQNSIYSNSNDGITLSVGVNNNIQPPVISSIEFDSIIYFSGVDPSSNIEVYADKEDEGEVYLGNATYDPGAGRFYFEIQETVPGFDWVTYPNVTAIRDSAGRSSEFSSAFPIANISAFNPLLVTRTDIPAGVSIPDTNTSLNDYGTLSGAIAYVNLFYNDFDTITFLPSLDTIWVLDDDTIPQLASRRVLIDGDHNSDNIPDITISYGIISEPSGVSTSILSIGALADDCHIKSLNIINGRGERNGIELYGGDNKVTGCVIGTDINGTIAMPNLNGIYSAGFDNTIGGPNAEDKNVISGNFRNGIKIHNQDNTIIGNYIGTNPSGNLSIPNEFSGIFLDSVSTGTNIGTAVRGNLISSNETEIYIEKTDGVNIHNNYIGLAANGQSPLSTTTSAIGLVEAKNIEIGGASTTANRIYTQTDGINIDESCEKEIVISHNLMRGDTSTNSSAVRFFGFNHSMVISNNVITGFDKAMRYSNNVDSIKFYNNSIYGNDTVFFGNGSFDSSKITPPTIVGYNPASRTVIGTGGIIGESVYVFADSSTQGQEFLGETIANTGGFWSFTIPEDSISALDSGLDYLTVMKDNASGFTSRFASTYVDFDFDPLLVTNTSDSGPGSLPTSVEYANNNSGPDTIRFDALLIGDTIEILFDLQLDSSDTYITGDVDENGTPDIILNLPAGNDASKAIEIGDQATNCHINGLILLGNSDDIGIDILGQNNKVTNCMVGTDFSNTFSRGFKRGIEINGSNNIIGDTLTSTRNIIASNSEEGIYVNGPNNIVINNYIGLGNDGLSSLGNGTKGINITTLGEQTLIGNDNDSSSANFGNYISANGQQGIFCEARDVDIHRNKIGVDVNGSSVPNGGSGSTGVGVLIQLSSSKTTLVENEIANHSQYGISIRTADSIGIFLNSIYSNGLGGIEFVSSPQNGFNSQALIASYDTTLGIITGTVPGLTGSGYVLQFFADNGDQGQEFLDTVSMDPDGSFSLTLMADKKDIANMLPSITVLTVELATNRTSQFSSPFCTGGAVSAGEDLFIACQGDTVQLNSEGISGSWFDVTPSGPLSRVSAQQIVTFDDDTDPSTSVYNFSKDTTVLVWNETSAACSSYDTLKVIVQNTVAVDDFIDVNPPVSLLSFQPSANDVFAANSNYTFDVINDNGSLTNYPNGITNSIQYPSSIPSEFIGDTIQYRITAAGGTCGDTAFVYLVVPTSPITAVADDTTFNLNDSCYYSIDVLSNDNITVSLSEVSLQLVGSPRNGNAVVTDEQQILYGGNDLKSEDSLRYELIYFDESENIEYRDTVQVNISFNEPSVLISTNDVFLDSTAFIGQSLTVSFDSLLANYDSSLPITVSIATNTSNAGVKISEEDSVIRILPRAFFYDLDSIQYEISYACTNVSSTGWISFKVGNNPPVAKRGDLFFESIRISIDLTRLVSDRDRNIAFVDTISSSISSTDTLAKIIFDEGKRFIRVGYKSVGFGIVKDSIRYYVCDEGGLCDTNWIVFTVDPEDPVIYNAVSPNESPDSYNDYMHIGNIDLYTYNRAQIFDRENKMVYDEENYNNEDIKWNGRTKNGELLNPGSYLLILKYGDSNSDFKTISTYVILKSSKDI